MVEQQTQQKKVNQYTVVRKLGKGGQAKVYLVQDAEGFSFAMKVFDLSNPYVSHSLQKFIDAERSVMKLRHANIVSLTDYSKCALMHRPGKQAKQVAYVVMELLGGALFDVLSVNIGLSERFCRYFFK